MRTLIQDHNYTRTLCHTILTEHSTIHFLYLLSFVQTRRKFIIAIINLRGVSTKLNKYIVFTMQTYKKLNTLLGKNKVEVRVRLHRKYRYLPQITMAASCIQTGEIEGLFAQAKGPFYSK